MNNQRKAARQYHNLSKLWQLGHFATLANSGNVGRNSNGTSNQSAASCCNIRHIVSLAADMYFTGSRPKHQKTTFYAEPGHLSWAPKGRHRLWPCPETLNSLLLSSIVGLYLRALPLALASHQDQSREQEGCVSNSGNEKGEPDCRTRQKSNTACSGLSGPGWRSCCP